MEVHQNRRCCKGFIFLYEGSVAETYGVERHRQVMLENPHAPFGRSEGEAAADVAVDMKGGLLRILPFPQNLIPHEADVPVGQSFIIVIKADLKEEVAGEIGVGQCIDTMNLRLLILQFLTK